MSDASGGAEIPVICGPTAAGKSDLALGLAARFGRAILVADSRQVYRGFDVGTAKPTAAEQARVPHLGIDLVEPTERYSAAQWASAADAWLAAGNPVPIVVGGTGLYLRALFTGLFEEPDLDPARRMALLDALDSRPTEELRRWVEALDPARAALGRTQLIRAIEVALLTGSRISDLHRARATVSRWRPRYLVIDPGPALHDRIARRFDSMIGAGWVEEVRALRERVPGTAPAWKASGYRTVRDVVDGRLSLVEARERILIETRQYAKRQRTWFRHQLPEDLTTRVNPEDSGAAAAVERWFAGFRGR
ncbi:MAG TPA: tRNA (adenosine(37)-N6)-dimethylallyltransferase MiaA [Gemmatimonadaceae bacterium]|nr:tRNA (adenosine(37)-N6)-dimethylallyltransferase MiaA [Gemmatimonadaceae bacterium]